MGHPFDGGSLSHRILDNVNAHIAADAHAAIEAAGDRCALSWVELVARSSLRRARMHPRSPIRPRQQPVCLIVPDNKA